jgi:hypothetical protein
MLCKTSCTRLKLRGCAKDVGALWHKDGDVERILGEGEVEAVEEVSIATVGF